MPLRWRARGVVILSKIQPRRGRLRESETIGRSCSRRSVVRRTSWRGCRKIRSRSFGERATLSRNPFSRPSSFLPFPAHCIDIQAATDTMRRSPSPSGIGSGTRRAWATSAATSGSRQERVARRLRTCPREGPRARRSALEQGSLVCKLARLLSRIVPHSSRTVRGGGI